MTYFPVCRCPACLAGDALPDHLQGIPGAQQLTLIGAAIQEGKINMPITDPCRDACAERCAEYGEPACYEIWKDTFLAASGVEWTPCADCLRDCRIEVVEQIDPDAAVRPLL